MISAVARIARRSLMPTALALGALFVTTSSASVGASGPVPVGGRAWTVPVIRLYDTTPPLYREGIDIAIRSWNDARVGIRFARTTRRDRAHVVVGTARFPGEVAGRATLGMAPGASVRLDTSLAATEPDERNNTIFDLAGGAVPELIADVMAHELGHVLGLRHVRGCALMAAQGATGCGFTPRRGQWTCRQLQRRDVEGASRRYGGPGVVRKRAYCPLSATPAGRIGPIKAAASTRERPTMLSWRHTTNTYGYVVARSAAGGPCPTKPEPATLDDFDSSNRHVEPWGAEKVVTRYCFAVWSQNGRGMLTGPTRVVVNYRPPTVAPISNLTATVAGDVVQFAWRNPPGTRVVRIYRSDEPGVKPCVVPRFLPVVRTLGGTSTASETDVPSGTWTYVVTRSDDPADDPDSDAPPEWASRPVCVNVTVP